MKSIFSLGWRVLIALVLVFGLGMSFAPSASADSWPIPDTGTVIIQKVTFPPGDPTTWEVFVPEEWGMPENKVGPIGDGEEIVLEGIPAGCWMIGEIWGQQYWGWDTITMEMGAEPDLHWGREAEFCLDPCDVQIIKFLNTKEHPEVNIIECPGCTDCAEDPYIVPVCTTFVIKAEITNTCFLPMGIGCKAPPVEVCLNWEGAEVEILGEHTPCERLGVLDVGETDTVAWTVHCEAPGETRFWVKTNYGGYDECTVDQQLEPGLELEFDAPCEICTDCAEDIFDVDVGVTNTGDCPIGDVQVIVTKNEDGCNVSRLSSSNIRYLGTIPGQTTVWFSDLPDGPIQYQCDGAGDTGRCQVQFIADAIGNPVCEDLPVEATLDHWIYQTETIVDVCVLPLSTQPNPSWGNYGEQKYLPACGEQCIQNVATTSYDPDGPYDQKFEIQAWVYNCSDVTIPKSFDVTLQGEWVLIDETDTGNFDTVDSDQTVDSAGDHWEYGQVCDSNGNWPSYEGDEWMSWRLLLDEPVYAYCLGAQRQMTLNPPFTLSDPPLQSDEPVTVTIDQVCPCCYGIVTWIAECLGPTCNEGNCLLAECELGDYPDPIEVTVWEVIPDSQKGGWSNWPCNPAGICQEEKAHLVTDMAAYVTDCYGCPIMVDTVALGQDFDVLLTVENRGQAAAMGVTVDVATYGPATCAPQSAHYILGTIPGGTTVSVWFSDILGYDCTCLSEGQVTFNINAIGGLDENTCEPIPVENIDSPCPLIVNQCDIQVEIVNPVDSTQICAGDEFAVKARLTNCGTCNFEDVEFGLFWEGPGLVMIEDSMWKSLPDLTKPDPRCTNCDPYPSCGLDDWDVKAPCKECVDCMTYEMSWQVRCIGPGDVTFHVCVTTDSDWMPEQSIHDCYQAPCCVQDSGWNDLDPVPHLVIQSINSPTIHQMPRPEIAIEIISPENLDTFVATGQEFTVTATIANKTAFRCCEDIPLMHYPVTITNLGLIMHPMSGATVLSSPEAPFVIPPRGTETVTWTLQCEESGILLIDAFANAFTYDCCPVVHAFSFPLLLWQYPAAHLEVEILETTPTTVNAGDAFDVDFTVTNTGEADATEVEAILSVIPEGTARPAAGFDQGYTLDIGTLAGHGQDGTFSGTWKMSCKTACESTINIDASGFDEYGWHKKQVCQSTGNFIIEDGCAILEQIGETGNGAPTAGMLAVLVGEASGLIGPFNLNVPISFNGEDMGNMVAMGAVLTDVDYTNMLSHINFITDCICEECPSLLDMLELFNLQGVDKDVMLFAGQVVMASPDDTFSSGPYCGTGGLLQVINGGFNGAAVSLTCIEGTDVMTFLDGTYCSTMAQEALKEIPEKFIEDGNVTVKQLASGGLDLGIVKVVDNPNPGIGDDIVYTIRVTNFGPTNASGVEVTDDLWDTIVSYVSSAASQGTYDETTGTWTVGSMTAGASATLMLTANVGAEDEFVNTATVTCDQPDGKPLNNSDWAVINASTPVIQLEQGWNFVSWPLIPNNPDIEPEGTGVLKDLVPFILNLETVWGEYDPVTGLWRNYTPGAPVDLTEMWDGVGFWIDMKTAGHAIVIEGQEQPDPPATPRVYPVVGGAGGYWNVVAFKSTTPKAPDDYLSAIAGQYTIIYGFDNGTYFVVGTPGHENLEPGLAYWVAVLESGNIFP